MTDWKDMTDKNDKNRKRKIWNNFENNSLTPNKIENESNKQFWLVTL